MDIEVLGREERLGLVARSHLARIACCKDGQPYIVPINYVLDEGFLYSFSTFGRKIEWMRSNPRVCVEIDDIAHSRNWESVIITGTYEELPDNPLHDANRDRAWALLQTRPNWWQPGFVRTIVSGVERPLVPIFFRIRLDDVSGHRLGPPPIPRNMQGSGGLGHFLRSLFGQDGSAASDNHGTKPSGG